MYFFFQKTKKQTWTSKKRIIDFITLPLVTEKLSFINAIVYLTIITQKKFYELSYDT